MSDAVSLTMGNSGGFTGRSIGGTDQFGGNIETTE